MSLPPDEPVLLWGKKQTTKTTFLILVAPAPMNTSHNAEKNQIRTSPRLRSPLQQLNYIVMFLLSGVSKNSQHPRNPQVWPFEHLRNHEVKFPNSDKTVIHIWCSCFKCWDAGQMGNNISSLSALYKKVQSGTSMRNAKAQTRERRCLSAAQKAPKAWARKRLSKLPHLIFYPNVNVLAFANPILLILSMQYGGNLDLNDCT